MELDHHVPPGGGSFSRSNGGVGAGPGHVDVRVRILLRAIEEVRPQPVCAGGHHHESKASVKGGELGGGVVQSGGCASTGDALGV